MANIAIVGSGVVGKATGKGFISKGHRVSFYDIRPQVVKKLKKEGYSADLAHALEINGHDLVFFTVSTPTEKMEINLNYLKEAAKNLGEKLRERKGYFVVVVRSTVPPGTTEDLVIPVLEKYSRKKAGRDFGVGMNPEYLREKFSEKDFREPWAITIGALDKKSFRLISEIYSGFNCPFHCLSLKEAEMQKYVHNLFNATKIAFFNEMRIICRAININPDQIFEITAESAEGSWNRKYGIRDFGPFDGMCLPKDTQAFLSWSKKVKVNMDILASVIKSNNKFKAFHKKKKR